MKRGRILDAFVIETLGLLLVLWLLGATFFFKQMPHPQNDAIAELNSDFEPLDRTVSQTNSSGANRKTFLGTELSEAERRAFTEQQLTLFGNAAKNLLKQVGKDAVKHLIQQVTASQSVPSASSQPQTVISQPAYQQPAYQQPAYQQPAYQQPAYQQPNQFGGNGGQVDASRTIRLRPSHQPSPEFVQGRFYR
ncbi:MAG: hypothetical protein ACI9G1_001776 [Pirellulaceae bacterium]